MRPIPQRPDLVLSNGAIVEFKVRRDEAGAVVIWRLEVFFPDPELIPPGGITAATLRELSLSGLTKATNLEQPYPPVFRLSSKDEERLVQLVRDFPRSTGGKAIAPIYPAAMAYLFERTLEEQPLNPNVALSVLLEVPVETVSTRLKRARALGFLLRGLKPRTGGTARGIASETARRQIREFLEKEEKK